MTGKRDWYKDGLLILTLLALVVPLRAYLIRNTEVVARDGVVFMRYALDLEKHSWKETLRNNHQHPGYPLSLLAVSVPVRAFMGETTAAMQFSAQLASSLAAVLLMFPMFFLGKLFFERRVAFWGTLLLQYLPASSHHFSDGISEPLFLLMVTSAFLFAILGLKSGQWPVASGQKRPESLSSLATGHWPLTTFSASGIFCGLAYLTRPEAVVVLAAVLVAIGLRQLIPVWRIQGRSALAGSLAMTLSALAVGSLYFGFTGTFSNKPSTSMPTFSDHVEMRQDAPVEEPQRVLFASIFAAHNSSHTPLGRLGQGVVIFGTELTQLFNYVGMVPLILGLAWSWRRLSRLPEFLLPVTYLAMFALAMLALAYKVGYISDRHLLTVALWGAYFAAAGLCDLTDRLRQWWPAVVPRLGGVSVAALIVVVGLAGACLPRTLQNIHSGQAGSREAGFWLARQMKAGDRVKDDHVWSSFYAGELFRTASTNPGTSYTVLMRSIDPKITEAEEQKLRSEHGQIVYHWPPQASDQQARVVIYAVANKNP